MRQIKMFKGIESELSTLEAEVNQLIAKKRVRVVQISGNIAPQSQADTKGVSRFPGSDVLIIVEYETESQ